MWAAIFVRIKVVVVINDKNTFSFDDKTSRLAARDVVDAADFMHCDRYVVGVPSMGGVALGLHCVEICNHSG